MVCFRPEADTLNPADLKRRSSLAVNQFDATRAADGTGKRLSFARIASQDNLMNSTGDSFRAKLAAAFRKKVQQKKEESRDLNL